MNRITIGGCDLQAGKQRAEGRHKFMETYLQQFQGEWEGRLWNKHSFSFN